MAAAALALALGSGFLAADDAPAPAPALPALPAFDRPAEAREVAERLAALGTGLDEARAIAAGDRVAMDRPDSSNPALVYQEIDVASLGALLAAAEPREGEAFVDLGSGVGKAVLAASMLFPFGSCRGLELLPGLHAQAAAAGEAAGADPARVRFEQGDLREADWSGADVVFCNCSVFDSELLDALGAAALRLAPGARLILTTHEVRAPAGAFELLLEAGGVSWWGATARVYRRAAR